MLCSIDVKQFFLEGFVAPRITNLYDNLKHGQSLSLPHIDYRFAMQC